MPYYIWDLKGTLIERTTHLEDLKFNQMESFESALNGILATVIMA